MFLSKMYLVHSSRIIPRDGVLVSAAIDMNGVVESQIEQKDIGLISRTTIHFTLNHLIIPHTSSHLSPPKCIIMIPLKSLFESSTINRNQIAGNAEDYFIMRRTLDLKVIPGACILIAGAERDEISRVIPKLIREKVKVQTLKDLSLSEIFEKFCAVNEIPILRPHSYAIPDEINSPVIMWSTPAGRMDPRYIHTVTGISPALYTLLHEYSACSFIEKVLQAWERALKIDGIEPLSQKTLHLLTSDSACSDLKDDLKHKFNDTFLPGFNVINLDTILFHEQAIPIPLNTFFSGKEEEKLEFFELVESVIEHLKTGRVELSSKVEKIRDDMVDKYFIQSSIPETLTITPTSTEEGHMSAVNPSIIDTEGPGGGTHRVTFCSVIYDNPFYNYNAVPRIMERAKEVGGIDLVSRIADVGGNKEAGALLVKGFEQYGIDQILNMFMQLNITMQPHRDLEIHDMSVTYVEPSEEATTAYFTPTLYLDTIVTRFNFFVDLINHKLESTGSLIDKAQGLLNEILDRSIEGTKEVILTTLLLDVVGLLNTQNQNPFIFPKFSWKPDDSPDDFDGASGYGEAPGAEIDVIGFTGFAMNTSLAGNSVLDADT